jgi:hypothetical protein
MPITAVRVLIGVFHASGFLAWLDDFLYLPEVRYVLILFWLLLSGPGRYSVSDSSRQCHEGPLSAPAFARVLETRFA